jgi:hypothetical protein
MLQRHREPRLLHPGTTYREAAMREKSHQRFEAQTVERLATVTANRRFELQFCDADGRTILLTLPLQVAVEVACTICDASVHAPYLVGGVRLNRGRP